MQFVSVHFQVGGTPALRVLSGFITNFILSDERKTATELLNNNDR